MSKLKIKSNDEGKVTHGEKESILRFSSDGTIIVATTLKSAHIFSVKSEKKIGLLNINDTSSIHIHPNQGKYIIAFVSNYAKASLVEVDPFVEDNGDTQSFCTITLPNSTDSSSIISHAFFCAGKQGGSEVIILELKSRGLNNVDVSMKKVFYKKESNILQTGELYPKSLSKQDTAVDERPALDSTPSKKRKAVSTNIVLGPGEGGGEALVVTDQSAMKRPKADSDDDDDDDEFALEDVDESEESIAQRLAQLSSELDRDTEDEEELLKIQNEASNKFIARNVTADSLSILLRQALTSNDDSQLEVALQVSDKNVEFYLGSCK